MKATIRGHTLAYDDAGRGRALVFIHGYPLDRTLWRPQMGALRSYGRCVALDLRGFGESDPPEETSSMDAFATDVVALMDHLQINRAVLCGLSMGGYVALAFADRWPDRLAGLILANTRAGADDEAGRAARMHAVKMAQEQGAEAIAGELLPKLLAENTRAGQPQVTAQVRAMMARQPVAAICATLRGMAARPDRRGLLPRITCPTLVITGEGDALFPVAESEFMAAAIPGAALTVIPGAGHLSSLEAPEAFNAAVGAFMQELR